MSPEKNDKLRKARETTPSRLHPGRALSRAELASLVADRVWEAHGIECAIDDKYVAKLEAGRIRWPGARYREALRAVLGAAGDEDLGFRNLGQSHASPWLPSSHPRPSLAREPDVVGAVLRRRAGLLRLEAELDARPGPVIGEKVLLLARDLLIALAHLGEAASRVAFEDDYPLDARIYLDAGCRASHSAGADELTGRLAARVLWDEAESDDGTRDPEVRKLADRPKVMTPRHYRPRVRDHRYLRTAPWLAQAGLRPHDVEKMVLWARGLIFRGASAQLRPKRISAAKFTFVTVPLP
jgi:hypothetical protein